MLNGKLQQVEAYNLTVRGIEITGLVVKSTWECFKKLESAEGHIVFTIDPPTKGYANTFNLLTGQPIDTVIAATNILSLQALAAPPGDPQTIRIPCALNVAGVTYPTGTPFCEVIDKVTSELETARSFLPPAKDITPGMLSELAVALGRAVGTWEAAPAWLIDWHDALTGTPAPLTRSALKDVTR